MKSFIITMTVINNYFTLLNGYPIPAVWLCVGRIKPQKIIVHYRIIPDHRIEVHAAFFFDGVAADPSAEFGAVVAVVVINETGFVVVILAAEAERVQIHHRAGFRIDRAERVVDVFRGTIAVRVQQGRHVLVAVRHVVVNLSVVRHRERRVKPGRFRVPDKGHGHRVIVQRVQHLNQLVTVVDEFLVFRQHVRGVDLLLEAAPHVVVAEFKPRIAVLRRNQAVFAVPAIGPAAVVFTWPCVGNECGRGFHSGPASRVGVPRQKGDFGGNLVKVRGKCKRCPRKMWRIAEKEEHPDHDQ